MWVAVERGVWMAGIAGHRVIVFLQENKTTDFYFPTLAAWGAAVANHGGAAGRAAELRPAARPQRLGALRDGRLPGAGRCRSTTTR